MRNEKFGGGVPPHLKDDTGGSAFSESGMVPRLRRRRWRMKAKRRLEETRACRALQAKAGDDVSDGSKPFLLSSFIFFLSFLKFIASSDKFHFEKGPLHMEKPEIISSRIVAMLPRGENNPRNSEGDFAVLNNGDILFAYSRYVGASGHDDAPCNVAALRSRDGGKSFAPVPFELARAADHNTKNIMSVSLCRLRTGELCLFYLCKQGPQSEVYLKRCTDEDTLAFAPARRIVPLKKDIYYVVNNCRVCKLPDGSLLLPLARHKIVTGADGRRGGDYFADAVFFLGSPDGTRWRQVSRAVRMPDPGYSRTGLQEPGAVVLPDGRVYGYFRTDRAFQYESFSSDGGATWSRPVPSRFSSPPSPMLIRLNPFTGVYWAVWNPIPNYNGRLDSERRWIHAGRNPLVLARSDNGLDFSPYAVLEDAPDHGFCYPAMLFTDEKTMLLSYCCGGEEDGMCLARTAIRQIILA